MIDDKTIERRAILHPKIREEVRDIYFEICSALTGRAMCRFSHTLRTFAEQGELYAQGRTKAGKIVTNAKGGMSYHNYGLALDIVLIIDGKVASWDEKKDFDKDGKSDWKEVVTIFKEHGWEWGGDWGFRDAPHFQKTFGYSVRQLLGLFENRKVDKNNYVLI
jgi:peptidoglycan L-alanyl-D-glutamate endopeptidase CwlK